MNGCIFKKISALIISALVLLLVASCGGGGGDDGPAGPPPSAPTGLTRASGDTQCVIYWSSVSNATSYNLYYDTSTGVTKSSLASAVVKETGITSPHTITGLTNGTPYYIVVTAVNANGESDVSSEVVTIPNEFGFEFVFVPSGIFIMGSPATELGHNTITEKQHQVTLTKSFFITTTEITQEQWQAVVGTMPWANPDCSACPVENVSWDDVNTLFIGTLNSGTAVYRLPTEAEWEYAARAGSTTAFANGDITVTGTADPDPALDLIGWYGYHNKATPQAVAGKNANDWGLYDMHGNVSEWAKDYYWGDLGIDPVTDPDNQNFTGLGHVTRSGDYGDTSEDCRSANRQGSTSASSVLGFRILREL